MIMEAYGVGDGVIMLRLYDSRHGRPVAFRLSRRRVTLYVCGITPYDTTHLGHARTFLLFDLLIRHLEVGWTAGPLRPERHGHRRVNLEEGGSRRRVMARTG